MSFSVTTVSTNRATTTTDSGGLDVALLGTLTAALQDTAASKVRSMSRGVVLLSGSVEFHRDDAARINWGTLGG